MTSETKFTHKRGSWSAAEDQKLLDLVEDAKSVRWVNIAELLGSRTSKQCRERYHQNLKPSLNHSPITPDEGKHIDHLVTVYGKRWAEISRHLKGRSDNAIKNWWNASANRRRSQSWRNGSVSSLHSISGGPGIHSHRGSISGPPSGPSSRNPSVDMIRRHSMQPLTQQRSHSTAGLVPGGGPGLGFGGPAGSSIHHHSMPYAPPPSHAAPPPQVEVIFNPSYQETFTPPSLSNSQSQSTCTSGGSSSASVGPRDSALPGSYSPQLQPSIAPHQQHPPPPVLPVPQFQHQHPHSYFSNHQATPYSRRDSRMDSRLPSIEPYLEERLRSLRKQSYDSNMDLARYSLSATSRPASPEASRRSSIAAPPCYHPPPRTPSPMLPAVTFRPEFMSSEN